MTTTTTSCSASGWTRTRAYRAPTSFGSFGGGGDLFETNAVPALTGSATYNGEAVGAHHMTGEAVSWFDADATLTANFDNDMIEREDRKHQCEWW